jgi:N-hydroxyarylamine O-acetyltransferase
MDLQCYLSRIHYSGLVQPTLEVLRNLHVQHLYSIPFENLDIPLQREISLDFQRIYDKLVTDRRGGFCYEQNALFAWALRQIGFDVDMLSARVSRPDGSFGPEFDHMLLLVRIDGQPWIADVGFGDSFVEPLRFRIDEEQRDRGLKYQITRQDAGYLLRRHDAHTWKNFFLFTTEPRRLEDFKPMCKWQQTSPESVFTSKRVCSRATPSGRITLTANALVVTENGIKIETPVTSVEEFEKLLNQHFGMELRFSVAA